MGQLNLIRALEMKVKTIDPINNGKMYLNIKT